MLYASHDPYAQFLHEHLDLAGIAHNGASVRTLDDSVLGGALLRLLALPDDGFRREALFTLLASVPFLDGTGHLAPGRSWERVSRAARVVGGLEQWHMLLDAYAAPLSDDGTDGGWERANANASPAYAPSWTLSPPTSIESRVPASWSGKATWAHRLVRRWIGAERRRGPWPVFEQEAARRVEAALDRLGGLDAVEAAPTLEVFRRTLELELTGARERVGRLGEGVLVGPVGFALGADLDRLFVCGLAEGVFPARPGDDPLLSDNERAVAGWRAAVAFGPNRSRPPRAAGGARLDRRRSGAVLPARRPAAEHRARAVAVPARHRADARRASRARHASGVVHADRVVHRRRGTRRVPVHGTRVRRAFGAGDRRARRHRVPAWARAARRATQRRVHAVRREPCGSRARVAARGPTAPGVVVSPTRLEKWVGCPHAYFMQYVLHIDPIEQPEEIVEAAAHRPRLDRARDARPVRRRGRHGSQIASVCTTSPMLFARASMPAVSRVAGCSGCASSGSSTTHSTPGSLPTTSTGASSGSRRWAPSIVSDRSS